MKQQATLLTRTGAIQFEMPAADTELVHGIKWGAVEAFPTPAYWHFNVLARRVTDCVITNRLGRTLVEEVGACLLGGHGIPAKIGLAAYAKLRNRGAFETPDPEAEQLEFWLREPLTVDGALVRYRFAAQKAKYLAAALPLSHRAPPVDSGRELRDWATSLPGVGLKTASWIARNWMDAQDVAILDIHIMRLGQLIGFFPEFLTVTKNYLELESRFLEFRRAIDVRPSELDALMWREMASSPSLVRMVIGFIESRRSGRDGSSG